jgi:hypothetical protein
MVGFRFRGLSVILLLISATLAPAQSGLQTVTLVPPVDPVTKEYDEGKATFSFKFGLTKKDTHGPYDLGYGFLSISDQDWFRVNNIGQNRTVIKDLGELGWHDSFIVPVLIPLPAIEKGEHRVVTVDASGDTHKQWAELSITFAKVELGHIYLVRVKTEIDDYYAMFRVEDFKQQQFCKISWRLLPAPAEIKP